MHLLVTRSALDAVSLEATLAAMGHTTSTSPLIEVERLPVELELTGVQGLIATSRNGLRVLTDDAIQKASTLPLFVVGPATGGAGARAGLSNRHRGTGRGARSASRHCSTREARGGTSAARDG